MNKTVRYVLYVVIIIICILSIFFGVYDQFFRDVSDDDMDYYDLNAVTANESDNNVTVEEAKNSFKDLFTNEYFGFDYDESNINKIDSTKPIVYNVEFNQKEEDKYDIQATLPFINISESVTTNYNSTTQTKFVDQLSSIMQNSDEYTICDISYTSYINNDILSVAIMESVKEEDKAQRLIIQTYNYNIVTKEDVSISDILDSRALDEATVNKRIKSTVGKAAEDAEAMQNTGYNIYERDTNSDKYDVTNVENFMQGPNGELYIIYAYGNETYTSEMDIVEI